MNGGGGREIEESPAKLFLVVIVELYCAIITPLSKCHNHVIFAYKSLINTCVAFFF